MKEIESKKEFKPKPKQIKFVSLYLDASKRLTQEEIAKEIGVTRKTIWNWFQNPDFVKWVNSQKDKLLETALIDIYKTAVRKAKSGHYLFAKLLLEMAGVYQPGLKLDTVQVELIKIEVVQSQAQAQKQEGDKLEDNQGNTNT